MISEEIRREEFDSQCQQCLRGVSQKIPPNIKRKIKSEVGHGDLMIPQQ